MIPTQARGDGGFTLVEAMIAMAVMGLGMTAAVVVLGRGAEHSDNATALLMTEDRARGALAGAFDVLTETDIQHVDTAMRVHTPSVLSDVFSDRFTIAGVTLKQCLSPTCSFHTKADLSTLSTRYSCGFDYCSGALGQPVVRGKVLPATMTSCPFDLGTLGSAARLDGVKFFVPRDSTNQFTADADGSPRWSGLVFLFPCATEDGLTELRRYDVSVSDLLTSPPSYSSGFNRFAPTNPTMIDLFDFGTDGTTNGVPDGKVPLTTTTSDARTEVFSVATYLTQPVILVSKSLGSGSIYPQRSLVLRINLATGATYFSVDHHDTATVYWSATRTFTRMPKTIVGGLTELAISTAVSHPYNAATNPTGVSEPRVVRITVGTSDSPKNPDTRWLHHVETFQIKTRN